VAWDFPRSLSVRERQRRAEREIAKLEARGSVQPVRIEGRAIAKTFWGRSWCQNLEGYSDYESRLPRGRSYLRSGSVLDLRVAPGRVEAKVSGTRLYEVEVTVAAMPRQRWQALRAACAGTIDSLVELLQGHLSKAVMERVCRQQSGLFPSPAEIAFRCSCPDWASMCKHVAAVLYGIGARLDTQPELLFELRRVDAKELVASAEGELPLGSKPLRPGRRLESAALSEMFGIEIAGAAARRPRRQRGRPGGGR
jgi:uncharacterized Zn finger protein